MNEKNLFQISLLVAFLEGCAVLAVELMGAKIIASYYGTSFFVWTSILGITLTSLTAGYYLGGKASSGKNQQNILWSLFFLSSIIIFFIPVVAAKMLMFFFSLGIRWGSVLSAIFIIGPPLFCFGGTTPLLIQLNSKNINHSGKIAGLIYAISTIGGILTSFLLGFWVIPQWGISSPLLMTAVIILLFGSILSPTKIHLMLNIILAVSVSFITSSKILFKNSPASFVNIIYLSEGILGQLKVKDVTYPEMPSVRMLTINEIPQTKNFNYTGNHGISVWRYPHIIGMVSSLKKFPGAQALVCGFGGGAIAYEISRLGFNIDVVDIDKRMQKIGLNYFYYNPSNTNFIIDDARHYINTTDKKYDLIVIDLLNGEIQPSHLFTIQSFTEIKKLLNPNSILILNYQGPADIKRGIAFESINNTLIESGMHTYYWSLMEGVTADILFYASLNPIDFKKLNKENMNNCCVNSYADNYIPSPYIAYNSKFKNAMILNDNQPILENLNTEAILVWRKGMIEAATK